MSGPVSASVKTRTASLAAGARRRSLSSIACFSLFFLRPQQKSRTDNRHEEDGLFAERVKATVIKIYGSHDIGNMALVNGDVVENVAIRAAIVSKRGQIVQRPDK